jgi:hypothetical protein
MRRLLLVSALLGTLAVQAFARAGGGESYSGSSSGSSSYSYGGGSSDSGDLLFTFLYLYIQLVVAKPLIGVPFTLFFVYMLWKINQEVHSAGPGRSEFGHSAHGGGQLSTRKVAELSRLRERDPAFDDRAFLRRAGAAFHKIQEAWSAGDMSTARAFISDGVRERFERQLGAMKARGVRNLMEGVEVRDIELLACVSDKHFDELCVRVVAAASDRMVDAEGGTVSGSSGRQEFEEVWTFLRRPGAKTLKKPGLIEGSCPSCGSPLPIADAAQCAACKSWVNSGEYDWVLSEITQSCEWRLRDPSRDVDGWAEAAAGDPALSLSALEDRASVIFWRWLDARRLGDAAPLRAVAGEGFCAGFAEAGGWGDAFEKAAVGAVEVVAFERAGAWRRAHIVVKWSAAGELRQNFFVLSRAAGARTDEHQGLRTARCPSCGAPPAERSEAVCAYCSNPLNDGKKDWVLTELIPFGQWKRPGGVSVAAGRVLPAVAGLDWGADMSPADAYGILARATLADGEESLAEKAFLESYARSRGLPPAKAGQIAAAARAGLLDAPKAEDGAQAETMLRGMIRMSLADGQVSEDERAALHSFAARFSLRPDDITLMISEERDAVSRSVRGVA